MAPSLDLDMLQSELASCRSGYTLPRYFYTDSDLFQIERRSILLNKWILGCHLSELPEPGSFLTLEIAGESIILIRGQDDQIRGFFNVCRHRGSRICLEMTGKTKLLTCPYHAWAYDTTGELVVHRGMGEGFDPAAHSLISCRIEVLEGLVFFNPGIGQAAEADFDAFARDLSPFLQAQGTARARVIAQRHYQIDANWKLVLENFHECFHCVPAHKTFTKLHGSAISEAIPGLAPDEEMADWFREVKAMGHFADHVSVRQPGQPQPYRAHRRPYRAGYQSHTVDGQPAAPLMGQFTRYDGGNTGVTIEPFSSLQGANDHATLFAIYPMDAKSTRMTLTWLVDADASDTECDRDRILEVWDVTTSEDKRIVLNNQRGVDSLAYQPGPYHPKEAQTQAMTDWYLAQMQEVSRPAAGKS